MNLPTWRQRIIIIAKTWLNTPFVHKARVKGAGVDCAHLLIAIFEEGRFGFWDEIPHYFPDFMLHLREEIYLNEILKVAEKTNNPLPGDIVAFKFGRIVSHAGILIEKNRMIHAFNQAEKVVETDLNNPFWKSRLVGYYTLKNFLESK